MQIRLSGIKYANMCAAQKKEELPDTITDANDFDLASSKPWIKDEVIFRLVSVFVPHTKALLTQAPCL
jgi:hypothetical protein